LVGQAIIMFIYNAWKNRQVEKSKKFIWTVDNKAFMSEILRRMFFLLLARFHNKNIIFICAMEHFLGQNWNFWKSN
jgi:hypothetical protein